jgi:ribosomal protein S18 acetylase RimI-like enzyme
MTPNSESRLLTLSDLDQAARVISLAFVDDPLCAFMLPMRRTRTKTLYKYFRAAGELGIRNNRGYGVGDPLLGVAFWKFPDPVGSPAGLKSLGSFLPLLLTFYPFGLLRARKVLERIDVMHAKYAPEPHFYLDNIGVLPAGRGRGVASQLIRPFLEMAEARRVSAYTDTVTRSNVALYEHLGFECMEESPVAGTGLTVWALRRPARESSRGH